MIINLVFLKSLVYSFIPILKEIIFLNPTICRISISRPELLTEHQPTPGPSNSELVPIGIGGFVDLGKLRPQTSLFPVMGYGDH
jgi:hypothetical protein